LKVTFVMPCVGRKPGASYVKTWQMEPLAIAVLAALTPPEWGRAFFDDRVEEIDYDAPTDLVAITVETYTARRAYQVAAAWRRRGVPVVMGGFHATLVPDEVAAHADAVVVGAAERAWPAVLADAAAGKLAPRYDAAGDHGFGSVTPDRSIWAGRRYLRVALVETGRGCRYRCEFCAVSAFFGARAFVRDIDAVIAEIRALGSPLVFFVDDNLGADRAHLRGLLEALVPLRIRWIGQLALDAAADDSLLALMRASGCIGVLVGFESLEAANLAAMNKRVNATVRDPGAAVEGLRRHGIAVYATFLFGYDDDNERTFEATLRFALDHRFFFTAFNHLVPFPGTPLYRRLEAQGRLRFERWWLDPHYRFGDVAFVPRGFSADELARTCLAYRRRFYSLPSIVRRGLDVRANTRGLLKASIYWAQSLASRGDVERRQGLPLGIPE
jgi:radical SAM superfamily enzyme YgiQ (UPF0313 family)